VNAKHAPSKAVAGYTSPVATRLAGITFLVVGATMATIGIMIGASMLRHLLDGPWLGPEPELLIPIAFWLVAGLLLWMGMKLWRQDEHG
jgi:hypothetical protein